MKNGESRAETIYTEFLTLNSESTITISGCLGQLEVISSKK